ncbi:sulfotransferase family protein [Ekhidna sp.]|uniref:sulfotransferase family protein n=1 Tax=Ekhidna sp. TaxID=2608089 RepID=UPI003B5A5317
MKIDFIIAGAQKSGTTALHKFLGNHESIFIPDKKELHYFDDSLKYLLDINYKSYHKNFENASLQDVKGEITPSYMTDRRYAKRIFKYNPNIKLIFVLRNPMYRAYSHYQMMVSRGIESWDFKRAITVVRKFPFKKTRYKNKFHYLQRGFYGQMIEEYLNFFPRNSILVLNHDEMERDLLSFLNKILSFLGVSEYKKIENEVVFSNRYESMPNDLKDFAYQFYKDDIKKLEHLTNISCENWKP